MFFAAQDCNSPQSNRRGHQVRTRLWNCPSLSEALLRAMAHGSGCFCSLLSRRWKCECPFWAILLKFTYLRSSHFVSIYLGTVCKVTIVASKKPGVKLLWEWLLDTQIGEAGVGSCCIIWWKAVFWRRAFLSGFPGWGASLWSEDLKL